MAPPAMQRALASASAGPLKAVATAAGQGKGGLPVCKRGGVNEGKGGKKGGLELCRASMGCLQRHRCHISSQNAGQMAPA